MKTIINESLAAQAFRASNGELAWQRKQLAEVVVAYTHQGYAVEAFEVWLVDDSGRWTGLIPTRDTDVASVCVYDVEEQGKSETRDAFVARCAEDILQKVQEWDVDNLVEDNLRPRIRYNLYVAEEYAEPGASADRAPPGR